MFCESATVICFFFFFFSTKQLRIYFGVVTTVTELLHSYSILSPGNHTLAVGNTLAGEIYEKKE